MKLTEERIEQIIGYLLRAGVVLSMFIVTIGAAVFLWRHGMEPPRYAVFRGEPADLRTIPGILGDLSAFRGRGLIQFGMLTLMATPVARVLFSLIAFVAAKDRVYIVVTVIVLSVLLYSITGGYASKPG